MSNLDSGGPKTLRSVKISFKLGLFGYHYLISNAPHLLLVSLLGIVLIYDGFSTLSTLDDLLQFWNELSFKLNYVTVLLKLLERSRIGNMTYGPKSLMDNPAENRHMKEAKKETDDVIIGAIDERLAKTGFKHKDIGILVVNSSLFNPTPSLSAFIVNHYKLRSNILSYNLGEVVTQDKRMVTYETSKRSWQVQPNSYTLVVSTENITLGLNTGNDRSMLLRTAYFVLVVAGEALKTHITALGPLVLPVSEQLLFIATSVGRKIFKMKIKQYPSRVTLYRFRNTSSSLVWYELAYAEAKRRIPKGDRICQIGFGAGFNCNTVVWPVLKTINLNPALDKNPWIDEIDDFPVQLPQFAPIAF
ncbi:hypothetical protein CICLE_v10013522mg [Citrus x clementina]|uniref:FAE domain-containing protein n=1 Tax=Citrus clementina TaxID=85681 RepID=V4S350_CITCL|nr:hypothetical protein CICLE_v10013522mg [Citrus x clementina]